MIEVIEPDDGTRMLRAAPRLDAPPASGEEKNLEVSYRESPTAEKQPHVF